MLTYYKIDSLWRMNFETILSYDNGIEMKLRRSRRGWWMLCVFGRKGGWERRNDITQLRTAVSYLNLTFYDVLNLYVLWYNYDIMWTLTLFLETFEWHIIWCNYFTLVTRTIVKWVTWCFMNGIEWYYCPVQSISHVSEINVNIWSMCFDFQLFLMHNCTEILC